jgi:hypothetical protein
MNNHSVVHGNRLVGERLRDRRSNICYEGISAKQTRKTQRAAFFEAVLQGKKRNQKQ